MIEGPTTVTVCTPLDLPYIVHLQRRNRESVGHLPTPAIQERIDRGSVSLLRINGDPAGYLLYDYRDGVLRVPQACIQYDARRRHYGERLWLSVIERFPDVREARLRCAADIEANLFWRGLGFTCTGVVNGGKRRGRLINVWVKQFAPSLFRLADIAVTPAAQIRVDAMYDDTGFIQADLDGFRTAVLLPKIAWADRKENRAA